MNEIKTQVKSNGLKGGYVADYRGRETTTINKSACVQGSFFLVNKYHCEKYWEPKMTFNKNGDLEDLSNE